MRIYLFDLEQLGAVYVPDEEKFDEKTLQEPRHGTLTVGRRSYRVLVDCRPDFMRRVIGIINPKTGKQSYIMWKSFQAAMASKIKSDPLLNRLQWRREAIYCGFLFIAFLFGIGFFKSFNVLYLSATEVFTFRRGFWMLFCGIHFLVFLRNAALLEFPIMLMEWYLKQKGVDVNNERNIW